MKKILIIFLLCVISLLLISCNSRDDVKHISQKKMINYVKGAIGEDLSLVSIDGKEDDSVMTYVFKLDDRNITFMATSLISALFIDGSRFGNYKEEINIKYEEGIVESEYYKTARLQIGNDLNIKEEDLKSGLAIINVDNYKDIDKLTRYAVELDKLYAFNETKPERIIHINLGAISFSDPTSSIGGPIFSTNKKDRLEYKDIFNELVNSYILQLRKFDGYDSTIPEDVWKKYNK